MQPIKRIVATTGTYTNQNGEEKKRYTTMGTLFQREDSSMCAKIDAVPVGEGWNGWVNFFDIEDRQQQQQPQQQPMQQPQQPAYQRAQANRPIQQQQLSQEFEDDIPF